MKNSETHTKYYIPNAISQQVRMLARIDLHKETDSDFESNKGIESIKVRQSVAGKLLNILIGEEKKKLLK